MKKFLALALSLSLAGLFVACDDKKEAKKEETKTEKPAEAAAPAAPAEAPTTDAPATDAGHEGHTDTPAETAPAAESTPAEAK
ncbi:hypothetical protein DCO58_07955 [Helicobacter saguini]|uniref:Lipoprotein n=1 Tax=Helicobacter saguini TaxID=1548018 RepID=A0A347VNJ9_9HELI|nr:hypothetical protein [Helicobacter saguini]MWV61739.1 hypothetical protein [Helicobacter saguini]MWV67588.1 hypothetical protein [Helicobacter saguini]MWV69939.1 hypothetical protein [Helicobacter saguini]MWV72846.1 hypothetical protein [Helicobacter saguini]TLD92385.1 hypothetical protein LS64_010360 [Helicobacter saguini]